MLDDDVTIFMGMAGALSGRRCAGGGAHSSSTVSSTAWSRPARISTTTFTKRAGSTTIWAPRSPTMRRLDDRSIACVIDTYAPAKRSSATTTCGLGISPRASRRGYPRRASSSTCSAGTSGARRTATASHGRLPRGCRSSAPPLRTPRRHGPVAGTSQVAGRRADRQHRGHHRVRQHRDPGGRAAPRWCWRRRRRTQSIRPACRRNSQRGRRRAQICDPDCHGRPPLAGRRGPA